MVQSVLQLGWNNLPVPPNKKFRFSVYVVELDAAILKDRLVLRRNPKRDASKPCVYVGMTGLTVERRFDNHRNGHKSSRFVKKYGLRLMPELYEHLNPMPYEALERFRLNTSRRNSVSRFNSMLH